MGNVFARKGRPSRVTEQDRAILQLKQQRDKLRQYQKKLTLQLEKERLLAKQLLKDGKKERALLLLKKKRYQDQLLDKTETQISNIERMVQDLEFAQIEVTVLEGLKVGNDCLKKMHEVLSIEEVERIMEETQEAIEYQKQVDEILAGSLNQEDEEAVLAELEAITQDEDVALPEVPAEPLPALPKGEKGATLSREKSSGNQAGWRDAGSLVTPRCLMIWFDHTHNQPHMSLPLFELSINKTQHTVLPLPLSSFHEASFVLKVPQPCASAFTLMMQGMLDFY
ncbi:charged multivesicular body protein 6-A isoform X2 [Salminus brasiliensis]|uniref:charged multivesicular body protein 6-A isoform X2 n=1 Tax=Salminus brasiliensis TaxID=930266 RepID=UPI003B833118